MESNSKTLAEYLDILVRRKLYVIIPLVSITLLSVIIALSLPRTFRSTATMLFEANLSNKLVESTMSQYADEQIQSILQKVLTAGTALEIIDEFDLYSNLKGTFTSRELADEFRQNTTVSLVTSSLASKSTSEKAEIAFTISFSDQDPQKARDVALKLANLFIEQNDTGRTQRAAKTTAFLTEESEKLERYIQVLNDKIARYKEKYNQSLPEQLEANRSDLERTETALRDADTQITLTKERITFLSAELARAQMDYPSATAGDNAPQTKEETLRKLQADYLRMSSIYSPSHPSLIRLEREIKALNPLFDGASSEESIRKELDDAKAELAAMEERYSGNHPDINTRRHHIASLEQKLKAAKPLAPQAANIVPRTTNFAYLNIEAQYKGAQSELQALMQRKRDLEDRLQNLQKTMSLAPQVEAEYLDLTRERDNSVKKHNELKEKLFDAKLVQTMEQGQQGQTLTMIEEPIAPKRPETAIRRKVAIGGFVVALAVGIGYALLLEFLDPGVRGYRAIRAVSGLTPLVVISYIESPQEIEERLRKQNAFRHAIRIGAILAALAVLILGFLYIPDLLHT